MVSALSSRGSTPSPALLARHPQRRLTPESLFAPLPSAFSLQALGFLFPACWRPVLSAPRWASLPYDPARDISLPWGPFLGCVGLSFQILSSHDLWSHLSTCFLNFNSCRAQAHVKRNFISVSSTGPSRPPPWRVQEPQVQRTDRLCCSVPTGQHLRETSLQACAGLSALSPCSPSSLSVSISQRVWLRLWSFLTYTPCLPRSNCCVFAVIPCR